MSKIIICLSAFLMVGSAASYASENAIEPNVTEVLIDGIAAKEQTAEEIADDVLTEITQTLVGCPRCPRNPKA